MKDLLQLTSAAAAVTMLLALSSCSTQDDMATKPAAKPAVAPAAKAPDSAPPAAKAEAPAKAKATKVAGDIGLLDTEKNYMILVTKEGKLLTLDFDKTTKVTKVTPTPGKITDVGLGSTAAVSYQQDKGKNIATVVEYRPAKGGD